MVAFKERKEKDEETQLVAGPGVTWHTLNERKRKRDIERCIDRLMETQSHDTQI